MSGEKNYLLRYYVWEPKRRGGPAVEQLKSQRFPAEDDSAAMKEALRRLQNLQDKEKPFMLVSLEEVRPLQFHPEGIPVAQETA